jgi:hypothetical protein
MQGIGRILIIVVVVIVAALGVSLLVLPSTAAKSQSFDVAMAAPSVIARLSTSPPNTALGAGVTQSGPATLAGNVITAPLAFADGGKGKATYTVTAKGAGAHVDARIERDLGFNPITRVSGMNGAPVAPAAAVFFPAVSNDVSHPADNEGPIDASSWQGLTYEVVQVQPQQFLYNEYCSPQEASEVKEAVRQSLEFVGVFISRNHLTQTGNPIAVETGWNDQTHQYCFQIGVPFSGTPPAHIYAGGIKVGQSPSGQAMRVHYDGDEAQVLPTYNKMEFAMWAAHIRADKSFEVYYDDPMQAAGSQNRDIYYLFAGDAAALQRAAPSAGTPPPVPTAQPAGAMTSTPTAAATTDTTAPATTTSP